MINFILVLLASIGLSHILVDGVIMNPIKRWFSNWKFLIELLNCYQCSGWWAGLICGGIWMLLPIFPWLRIVLMAFAASYLSTMAIVTIQYLNIGAAKNAK